ncbi:unnamed protein product [Linum tenue]|uniref:AB hydrolase-1 domain-containing protein n=1 Tax=Linum tenue TaxID=586396 RepID=A0AAV0PAE0_9ROSI|nr:unnamed protein product [Linum tenue]
MPAGDNNSFPGSVAIALAAIIIPILLSIFARNPPISRRPSNPNLTVKDPNFSADMDGIRHSNLTLNGINVHVAESGPADGPVVLFVHGFPELWYCWRHQMAAVASNGYRAVAPDLRGFGDTDAPADPASYTALHVVGDLVALIDAVAPEGQKVFVVAHDWGAYMAWYLCLFRPDKVKALVNMSVLFNPRSPNRKPLPTLKAFLGDDYYVCRFQEPGVIEAEFAELGTERVLKEFFAYHTPAPLYMPKGKPFGHSQDAQIALPPWLSEEDLKHYTDKFEKTGFTGGLNYYRNIDRELGTDCAVAKGPSESAGEVHRRRSGPYL